MTDQDDLPNVATITGWAVAGFGSVLAILVIAYSVMVLVF